jgi:hypothetical protein
LTAEGVAPWAESPTLGSIQPREATVKRIPPVKKEKDTK